MNTSSTTTNEEQRRHNSAEEGTFQFDAFVGRGRHGPDRRWRAVHPLFSARPRLLPYHLMEVVLFS